MEKAHCIGCKREMEIDGAEVFRMKGASFFCGVCTTKRAEVLKAIAEGKYEKDKDAMDWSKFGFTKPVAKRPTWDDYFMQIALSAATRSSCYSEAKGAAIAVNNRIVSIGYTGAPAGVTSCLEHGFCRKRKLGYGHGEGNHECLAVHAEANAILSAARVGTSIEGGTIYSTHKPCGDCAKLIINAGLKVVKYRLHYDSKLTDLLFHEANISVTRMS